MKKKIWKVFNIILYVYAFYLSIRSVVFVVMNDNSWMLAVMAVLICPVTYWFLRKKFGKQKPVAVKAFRGVTLALSPFLFGLAILLAPYRRCFDFAVSNEAKAYFEEHIETEQIEYKGVSAIKKPVYADYNQVTATVEYADKKTGQTMHQEVAMYFDRVNGEFFETFDEMIAYRREHADEELIVAFHFNEITLNERMNEVIEYVTGNDYEGIRQVLDESCQTEVKESRWAGWQQELAPLGSYQRLENVTQSLEVQEDEYHTQTLTIVATLRYVGGAAEVELEVNEDLTLGRLEIRVNDGSGS